MKIKDYKCKCGSDDFFFAENGNSMGIYCSYCGKWKKWADKNERNLSMKRERKTGEWIDKGEDYMIRWTCSNCGRRDTHIYNFCPDCGADMRGENNELHK